VALHEHERLLVGGVGSEYALDLFLLGGVIAALGAILVVLLAPLGIALGRRGNPFMTGKTAIEILTAPILAVIGGRRKRYEARHVLVSNLVRLAGFRLYNKNLSWPEDPEFRAVWAAFPYGGSFIHERKFNLYSIARSIRDVPGDLAECGVFQGGSSHLMLAATEGTDKHLYGFDSFQGLSEPGDQDRVEDRRAFEWAPHDMAAGEDVARHGLQGHPGRFTLLKGWIPEKFDEVADRRFSLVHIDVDLYEPTLATLQFFYPRMSPGGMIVCDDYGSRACPGARRAMDEFIADKPEARVIHLTTGQGVVSRHPLD
jgi:hypothetical protein